MPSHVSFRGAQNTRQLTASLAFCVALSLSAPDSAAELELDVQQITHGPHHHFFGYIGQCRTIPWNESGRYLVALRTSFHDRMPEPADAAEIVLLDTHHDYRVIPIDKTHGWNFQQGTMFYWNPAAPDKQLLFNDRDPRTQQVFTVLYDIEKRKRLREFRFPDTPVGNGGVAQNGGYFIGINYARMARLRPVTGYPGAADWSEGENAPRDDGVFRIDLETGKKTLLVSFHELAERLRPHYPNVDEMGLYINHTLCNRTGDRVFFFARGRLGRKAITANMPCTIKPDGTELTTQQFIGGHPEWAEDHLMIGAQEGRQVLYDVSRRTLVGVLGTQEILSEPEGDISLSPRGTWLANGYARDGKNYYVVLRRSDNTFGRSQGFSRGPYTRGALRIDPAPRWNRAGDALLVPGFTESATRQLFVIRIRS